MSRGLSTAFKDALGQSVVYPAIFVQFEFENSTTRFWSGEVGITADLGEGSESWIGGGMLGEIKTSGEGEDMQARNITFTLNGVDQAYYSTAISEDYRGRPVKVWFGLLDSLGTTVDYHYLLEEARMDVLEIKETESTLVLVMKCESRLIDLFQARRVFFNNEDLQKEHPTDLFYEYTPTLPGKQLPWGLKAPSTSGGGDNNSGGEPTSGNY